MTDKLRTTEEQLIWLNLRFMLEQYRSMADDDAKKGWSHQSISNI